MKTEIRSMLDGGSQAAGIYKSVVAQVPYRSGREHRFIAEAYDTYSNRYVGEPSTNGLIFEYLVCETLSKSGLPYYYQAELNHIPNATFDVLLYHPITPRVLTMKVSLRERYKQAALEGGALQQVYRSSEVYLVTMHSNEARLVSQKIRDGDCPGISRCILAKKPDFSKLIAELVQFNECDPLGGFGLAQSRCPVLKGKYFG